MDAVRSRYDLARSYVSRLCQPKGTAYGLEWRMSIPADDKDPDLVIARSLDDIPELLKLLKRARELLGSGECGDCSWKHKCETCIEIGKFIEDLEKVT